MSLALVAAVPSDTSPEQRERDQRFISALDTLLSHRGATHSASDLVALVEGPEGLIQGNVASRLLRAGVPSHTAELVARTVSAAGDLTAWWPAERTRVQAPADLAAIAQPIFGRSAQEQLHIAIVDGRNGLLDLRHVYTGTATGTSVRIGELLRPVLRRMASASLRSTTIRAATPSRQTKTSASRVNSSPPPGYSMLSSLTTW